MILPLVSIIVVLVSLIGNKNSKIENKKARHFVNQNSEIFEISEFFDVDTVSMGFCLVPLPRPDDESSGYLCQARSSGLSWAQELITIEVNHMGRHFCNPNFGFPRNVVCIFFIRGKI